MCQKLYHINMASLLNIAKNIEIEVISNDKKLSFWGWSEHSEAKEDLYDFWHSITYDTTSYFIYFFRYDKPCTYYDAILPLRVLLLKYTNPKVYELVCLLMDHNEQLEANCKKRRQTLVDFLRKSCKLANDFSDFEVHRVLGILSVNSFVVHDGGSDEANSDLIGNSLTIRIVEALKLVEGQAKSPLYCIIFK